jgi:hypothetical protein
MSWRTHDGRRQRGTACPLLYRYRLTHTYCSLTRLPPTQPFVGAPILQRHFQVPWRAPRRRPPCRRNLPRHAPCQPQQEGWKGRCPVVSNRPLHRAMQQRCHHASASARSPSSPPMPRPLYGLPTTIPMPQYTITGYNPQPVVSGVPGQGQA